RRPLELFSTAHNRCSGRSTSSDMENNNQSNANLWVDDRLRLAKLKPDSEWQPNVHRAFERFRDQRDAKRSRERRWILAMAVPAAISLLIVAFPATRTFAERWATACVTLLGNLSHSGPSLTYSVREDRK